MSLSNDALAYKDAVRRESWAMVFQFGFAPYLGRERLERLAVALRADDARITQGSTTIPPPLQCVQDWPVEAACAIGFAGWIGDDLVNVGEVEEFFAKACYEADQRLGEPAACRFYLNWFDEAPRKECFAQLADLIDEMIKRELI